jgi:hypothetical protein
VAEMARKIRLEYGGAIYHVRNRGDRREPIFKDDQDREAVPGALAEARAKTGRVALSGLVTVCVASFPGRCPGLKSGALRAGGLAAPKAP